MWVHRYYGMEIIRLLYSYQMLEDWLNIRSLHVHSVWTCIVNVHVRIKLQMKNDGSFNGQRKAIYILITLFSWQLQRRNTINPLCIKTKVSQRVSDVGKIFSYIWKYTLIINTDIVEIIYLELIVDKFRITQELFVENISPFRCKSLSMYDWYHITVRTNNLFQQENISLASCFSHNLFLHKLRP